MAVISWPGTGTRSLSVSIKIGLAVFFAANLAFFATPNSFAGTPVDYPHSPVLSNLVTQHARRLVDLCANLLNDLALQNAVPEKVFFFLKANANSFHNPRDRQIIMGARAFDDEILNGLSSDARSHIVDILRNYFGPREILESRPAEPFLQESEQKSEIAKMLAFKEKKQWSEAISTFDSWPAPLRGNIKARQTLGLALNKRGEPGDWDRAEEELKNVLVDDGPSGETYGLLASVYKSKWKNLRNQGQIAKSRIYLDLAIETYYKGLMSDQDYYPGEAMITLLYERGTKEDFQLAGEIAVLVKHFLKTRDPKTQTFWDAEAGMKLEILSRNWYRALELFPKVMELPAEVWYYETALGDLKLMKAAWERFQTMGLISAEDITQLQRFIDHFQAVIDEMSKAHLQGDANQASGGK